MRHERFKRPEQTTIYHCTSHLRGYVPYLGDADKDHLRLLFQEYEAFCGVRVLAYCLMDNHFHAVVEVPPRPEVLPTAEEVVRRLEALTCVKVHPREVAQKVARFREAGDAAGERAYLERFYQQMWDVSEYMKAVKQHFSTWHNRRSGKLGGLWKDRFHSVLVEPGEALLRVSAYVDLNPVRAGMTATPESHRWSSYAEAMAGSAKAKAGIQEVMSAWAGRPLEVEESLREYRCQMYLQGEERINAAGQVERRGLQREEVVAMVAQRGVVTMAEYLGCRVRYFSDGLAVGTREFVEGIFRRYRDGFGARRKDGARSLAGLPPGNLYALRPYHRGALS